MEKVREGEIWLGGAPPDSVFTIRWKLNGIGAMLHAPAVSILDGTFP